MRIFRKRNVHEDNIRLIREPLDIFIKNGEAITKLASPLIIAKVHYDDLQFYTNDVKVGIEIREVIPNKNINGIEIGTIIHISLYNKNNLFQ